MKGWYVPARPDEPPGESTSWYASFWSFVAVYLRERFEGDWCLSPEQSLSLLTGDWTVIPVERRRDYMAALESASVDQDIEPFTIFLAGLLDHRAANAPQVRNQA